MKFEKNKFFKISIILIILILISLINNKSFATGDEENVVISTMSVYKDMDYSFLSTFDYGKTQDIDCLLTFDTVEDLVASDDVRLKKGRYISTLGYYSVGDLGGAKYLIDDKQEISGAIQLKNGLYANYIPDKYTNSDGTKWAVISMIQLGAKGDGNVSCQEAFNRAFGFSNIYADKEGYDRTVIYLPKGEYKVTNQIHGNAKKANFVGEGNESIIFTDNDYRKDSSYEETFFVCWGTTDSFFGKFKIEARESNWTKYMRQMCVFYTQNLYLYGITYNIPQEAWIPTYYEDKQYTNLTIFTGDKQVTVDNCTMYQMSGTYRGANIGIMDFWSGITEDITIMNCELHDNARDEQMGIFSVSGKETSQIHNVDFINNKVYTYSTPYKNIHGHRTMGFTVAYNSNSVDDVNFSNNHFISEIDSKFMTFGSVTNFKMRNNIIEIICSYPFGGYVFDSSDWDNNNILIDNNQFYLTHQNGASGGKSFVAGKLTFKNNRVVSDYGIFKFADWEGIYENNHLISFGGLNSFGSGIVYKNNTLDLYTGHSGGFNEVAFILNRSGDYDYIYSGNTINDYAYYYGRRNEKALDRLGTILGLTANSITFTNNTYNCPNYGYSSPDESNWAFWYRGSNTPNITCTGNNLQGIKTAFEYEYPAELNTYREFTVDPDKPLISSINITHNGEIINEISTVEKNITLDKIVKIATEADDDGNITKEEVVTDRDIVWVSSVDKIASVNQNGKVTRNKYGSVYIYAGSKDGSRVYGKIKINFIDQEASDFNFDKEEISIKINQEYEITYEVAPKGNVYKKLNWSSKDESIVTVDSKGKIKGVDLGETEIVATTTDGSNISKSIRVKVESNKVTKMNLNKGFIYCDQKGKTEQLQVVNFTPDDSINKEIGSWTSGNESVATVDQNGLVTIVGCGYSGIHAVLKDGSCNAYCGVYVKPDKITTLTATAAKTEVELKCDTIPNIYTYNFYRYDESTSKWVKIGNVTKKDDETTVGIKDNNLSANTEYKYCVKGYVQSWESGSTIQHEGDESNICTVKTTDKEYVRQVDLRTGKVLVCVGDPYYVLPRVYPFNAETVNLSYEIEDTSIAEIESVTESTVKVVGKSAGTTKLHAYSNDEFGATSTIPVVVTPKYHVSDLECELSYNTVNFKWKKSADEDKIDGYIVLRSPTYGLQRIATIEKADLCKSTYSDGEECYLYVDTGLSFSTKYHYAVVPFYYVDGEVCETQGSRLVDVTTPDYYPVESVVSENEYILKLNEEKTISVDASNENASIKKFVWYTRNNNIVQIKDTTDKSATIKGLSTGIGVIDIVADDQDSNFVSPKVVVLPDDISNFEVEMIGQKAELSWDSVTGATGYNIYKYNDEKSEWEVIDTSLESSYTEYNLEAEKDYKYKVSAYVSDAEKTYEGNCTNEVSVKSGDDSTLGEELFFNSNKYIIKNGFVYQIKNETTKGKFLENVNTNGLIKFIRPDESEVNADEFLGTGMTLRLIKAGKKVEFKVAVEGDLSGDGCVTAQDYSTINKVVLGILTIENEDYLASDLDYNGEITATDLSTVNKMLLGII